MVRYLNGNFNLLDRTDALWPQLGFPALRGVDGSAHLGPNITVRPPVRVCAHASIGASSVLGPHAVIGNKAQVQPKSVIQRSVVFDKVEVQGNFDSQVLTPWGSVQVDLTIVGGDVVWEREEERTKL